MATEVLLISSGPTVVAPGEVCTIKFTVKNNNNWIAQDVEAHLVYPGDAIFSHPAEPVLVSEIKSLAKGASRTYTCTFNLPAGVKTICELKGVRYYNPRLHVSLGNSNWERVTGSVPLTMALIDMRYNPRVLAITVNRTPSEDSPAVSVNLKCALEEGADAGYSGLNLMLRWREADSASWAGSIPADVADALSALGATIAPSAVFEAGKSYVFRAEFFDGFDTAFSEVPLTKAFKVLNVHPASLNIGEGQFAVADDSEGLVHDTMYKYRFHAGAEDENGKPIGMDIYSTDRRVVGEWIDGKPIYRKVLSTGAAMANGATKNISLGESAISSLIRLEGTKPPDANGQITMLPTSTYNNLAYNTDLALQSYNDNPSIRIRCGSSTGLAANCYIIIEYTLPD